jgi:hypothetical protein
VAICAQFLSSRSRFRFCFDMGKPPKKFGALAKSKTSALILATLATGILPVANSKESPPRLPEDRAVTYAASASSMAAGIPSNSPLLNLSLLASRLYSPSGQPLLPESASPRTGRQRPC